MQIDRVGGRTNGTVDFGRSHFIWRRTDLASTRVPVRSVVVCGVLALVAFGVTLISLSTGDFDVSVAEAARALFGTASSQVELVVTQWRLPRVLLALVLGGALGVSGAIFQSITRNPLGSPDIIGFNVGAYTGAIAVIMLLRGNYLQIAGGALAGGLLTAFAVYLLAFKKGVQGFRLIIVGIAVSALLGSVNTWMLIKADLMWAMSAAVWGAGSLNETSWTQFYPVLALTLLLVPLALALATRMQLLEMGDDAARSLGVRAEPARVSLVVVGVALTAVATAAAGPIAFVSLAAPQLVRRLTKGAGIELLPSAFMGMVLLVASDLIAQRAFAPAQLPVGVVTVSLGGIYLVWLLAREARRRK